MPLYDYKCECGKEFEALRTIDECESAPCECGKTASRTFSTRAARYHAFPEGWWDTLDVEPVYIKNKRQLKEECAKRGLSSVYLLDS